LYLAALTGYGSLILNSGVVVEFPNQAAEHDCVKVSGAPEV
jgi:hypothetical protein